MAGLREILSRPDTLMHMKLGALVALFFLAEAMLVAIGYPGTAISAGATLALIGFEWYQVMHDKGTGEWSDVFAGSVCSWIVGALVGHFGLPTL